MRSGNPPLRKEGSLRVATREKGAWKAEGGNRANRANRANPRPGDLALARQVTFQVTYGVGWGDPALRE